jgi:hypothetical protein
VELFKDFGIWKIVAHIAFKFYSGASETFLQAQRPRSPAPSERSERENPEPASARGVRVERVVGLQTLAPPRPALAWFGRTHRP